MGFDVVCAEGVAGSGRAANSWRRGVINDERLAWQKTAVRKNSGAGGEEKVQKGTVKATSKATVKDTDDDTDTALGLFGIRQQ